MNSLKSLRIVLVLTFIGSGLNCLSYALVALVLPQLQELFSSGSLTLPEEMMVAFETILKPSRFFYFLMALFYALSLYGAILMWKVRKTGFHCYTLAQLVLLTIPVLFMGKAYFAIGDAMLTLMFVLFYFVTLKSLGAFSSRTDDDNAFPSPDDTLDSQPDDDLDYTIDSCQDTESSDSEHNSDN